MLKRERLMTLCKSMFIIGTLGLEAPFMLAAFYQNIFMGIAFFLLALMVDGIVLYSYLCYLTED